MVLYPRTSSVLAIAAILATSTPLLGGKDSTLAVAEGMDSSNRPVAYCLHHDGGLYLMRGNTSAFACFASKVQSLVQTRASTGTPGVAYLAQGQMYAVIGGISRAVLPLPGCVYRAASSTCIEVKWSAGLMHPEHANVISADEEGKWIPAEGFEWEGNPGALKVRPFTPPSSGRGFNPLFPLAPLFSGGGACRPPSADGSPQGGRRSDPAPDECTNQKIQATGICTACNYALSTPPPARRQDRWAGPSPRYRRQVSWRASTHAR